MSKKIKTDDDKVSYALDILDIADDAIICLDRNYQIIFFNNGAEKIFGYKVKEVLNKPLDILIPHRYHEKHQKLVDKFSRQQKKSKIMNERSTVLALHKNGKEFPAQVTISKSKQDKDIFYMAILRDISVMKSLEESLQKANQNLEEKIQQRTKELKQEINAKKKAQKELEKEFKARIEAEQKRAESILIVEKSSKLASIGVIAAGITHEINQPLNAIKIITDSILYSERKNTGTIPKNLIAKLEKVSEGANRINQIVYHMRSFWDSNQNTDTKINVVQTVQKAISLIEQQLYSHGIKLERDFGESNIFIKGNAIHLEQIIINITVNAMHAIDSSGKTEKYLKISLANSNDMCIIQFIDNGTGFAKNISSKKLFDPFYSTKKQGGMGLGLTIVKYFIEKLEGSIDFYNNDLGGATFHLELPVQ